MAAVDCQVRSGSSGSSSAKCAEPDSTGRDARVAGFYARLREPAMQAPLAAGRRFRALAAAYARELLAAPGARGAAAAPGGKMRSELRRFLAVAEGLDAAAEGLDGEAAGAAAGAAAGTAAV